MRHARPITNYHQHIPSGPFDRKILHTNDTIKNEVFGSLEYLSEVENVGYEFLKKTHQPVDIRRRFLLFQAFIRQAKSFYEAADVLHLRASPLNYYYSFLNLAKAFIALSDHSSVSGQIHHGLIYREKPGPISRQVVKTRKGVFSEFFKLVTGHSINHKTPLNIANLLGYCRDVNFEHKLGNFGDPKLAFCKIRIGVHKPNNSAHPILACLGYERLMKYQKSLKPFRMYFEEVELNELEIVELFDVSAGYTDGYRIFESKITYQAYQNGVVAFPPIVSDSYNALQYFFESNAYPDGMDFMLVAPLRTNLQIPMREILAIYSVMFFLASLVRYHPHYLEKLYASADAWILERFIRSSPVSFLRQIRNLIDGRVFAYNAR